MGIDYSFNLAVGFIVDTEDFIKPFRTMNEEKFHMEDRFDPKSGKKVGQEKVIDQEAEEAYTYKGKTYEEQYEFLEALCEDLGCTVDDGGGYSDNEKVYISVDFETDDSGQDYGRVCVGGAATFDEIAKCKKKCADLKKALNKLGVSSLGEAMVYVSPNIS